MGIIEDVEEAAEQLFEGYVKGGEVELSGVKLHTALAIVGIGGSAMAGEILRGLLGDRLSVTVLRGPELRLVEVPLYFVVSYSGNTWETLLAFKSLLERGERNIVVFTSGGRLGGLAEKLGLPWVKLRAGRQPRADLYEQVSAMLRILERLGVKLDLSESLRDAARVFEERRTGRGLVVEIASELNGRSAAIYGYGYLYPAALRWKQQLNENSRTLAWSEELPEALHNSIVGWDGYPDPDQYVVITLRDGEAEPAPIREEIDWFERLLDEKGFVRFRIEALGKSRVSRLLGLAYLGDLVSVELAMIRGLDPEDVRAISALKKHMAEWGIGRLLQ